MTDGARASSDEHCQHSLSSFTAPPPSPIRWQCLPQCHPFLFPSHPQCHPPQLALSSITPYVTRHLPITRLPQCHLPSGTDYSYQQSYSPHPTIPISHNPPPCHYPHCQSSWCLSGSISVGPASILYFVPVGSRLALIPPPEWPDSAAALRYYSFCSSYSNFSSTVEGDLTDPLSPSRSLSPFLSKRHHRSPHPPLLSPPATLPNHPLPPNSSSSS